MRGIVEVLTSKPTRTGGTVYNAKIGDNWVGCGFKEPEFKQGDEIEYETEVNGQYTNMGPFTIIQAGAAPAVTRDPSGISPVDRRTALHAARASAIEMLQLLTSVDGVKLPAKESGKTSALEALLDEYTQKWYEQSIAVMKGEFNFGADGELPEDDIPF